MAGLPSSGQRIAVTGKNHPHRGKSATVLGHEVIALLSTLAARVLSDDGSQFFVFAEDWAPMPESRSNRRRKK